MIRFITFLFLVFISTFSIAQEIESGVIAIASNPIKITNAQGEVRIAKTGDKIYLNDTIQTDAQGKIQILLKDQMTISLGPNSQMVVDKFVYDPKEKSKNELSTQIKQGAFKFISGKIASDNKDAMKVSIPKATIAIRGTAVAGNVDPSGASTIVLLHGAISLTNGSNIVDITKSGYGSQITNTGAISSPVPIPASTIKSINTNVQAQSQNTGAQATTTATGAASPSPPNSSTSALGGSIYSNTINTNIVFSDSSGNTFSFNNYQLTTTDMVNVQQIAANQGSFAAAASYLRLLGVDTTNNLDINYVIASLPYQDQIDLIILSEKNQGTLINQLGADFNILNGSIFPSQIFPISEIIFNRAGENLVFNSNGSPGGSIVSQEVTLNFRTGYLINSYVIQSVLGNAGSIGSPEIATIAFSKIQTAGSTGQVYFLPTNPLTNGTPIINQAQFAISNDNTKASGVFFLGITGINPSTGKMDLLKNSYVVSGAVH